jgi:type IV secretion system protein VirD4
VANTEDIHGSSRFATAGDIEETGLLETGSGVYVGGWRDRSTRRLHYLQHDGPEHVLAFAPSRSGKGVSLVIPTLLAWEESAVVYDIKGENWAKTAGYRAMRGHLCCRFSPVESAGGTRFNPLAELRLFTDRDVSDAQNMVEIIVPVEESKNAEEEYFRKTAASLLTGMILHVCYEAAREGRTACMAGLSQLFTRPGRTFAETLEDLLNFEHDPGNAHGWQTPTGEATTTHPCVREKAQEMLDKAESEKEFIGVVSTAKTALSLFSDPLVARNTAVSDFRIDDLVNLSRPISLYIVIPAPDKARLRPLIKLIFTLIVNRLCEKMVFHGTEVLRSKHRLLLLIDEFPSLKRMELFADALSYMAGYGLKAYLITQDIRQIVEAYGPNESIVSNCHVRIAFAPNQQDTAELLSKMTGMATVQKAAYMFSGSRLAPLLNHVNASVDLVQRPLMTPDEVSRLRPPKKRGKGDKERIVKPGQMLIFVGGHHPILGTQMLYFFDPVLKARAALPPPVEPARIPAPRPVEPVAEVENLTPREAAFLQELRNLKTRGGAEDSEHEAVWESVFDTDAEPEFVITGGATDDAEEPH